MLILLNVMEQTFWDIRNAREFGTSLFPEVKMSFWAFLFGVLIEWQGLKQILDRKVQINLSIIPAILLLFISFIPRDFWYLWFGTGDFTLDWLVKPLRLTETQIILNLLSGILLIRSLSGNVAIKPFMED